MAAPAQGGEARKRTVLVVEDEQMIRLLATIQLEDLGFEVLEAACAAEAVQIVEQGQQIDLVVTDVRMPGDMDGLMLSNWLRARRPAIKILVASGYCGPEDEPAGRPSFDDFLQKPFTASQLGARVTHLLAA